jgi:hypothetical protein
LPTPLYDMRNYKIKMAKVSYMNICAHGCTTGQVYENLPAC